MTAKVVSTVGSVLSAVVVGCGGVGVMLVWRYRYLGQHRCKSIFSRDARVAER